jgi:hypothetical protein
VTLNEKIEEAWMKIREGRHGLAGKERREFDVRFMHIIADQFDTTLDRVRERIVKIEKRERKKESDAQA